MRKFEWMGDYHLSKDPNALNRENKEFVKGEDEMLWLRETYLPNLDDEFRSAILYGNENHPEGFEVFKSEDADGTSEIYVRNYKPEESVMNRFDKNAKIRRIAQMAKRIREEEDFVIEYESSGLGKFDSNVEEFVYEKVMDGWSSEELGESESFGHYDLVLFGKPVTVKQDTGDWSFVAAIMKEDSQGFISVDYFDTDKEAKDAWSQIEKEYENFFEDEDSEEFGESVQRRASRMIESVKRGGNPNKIVG